MVLEIIPIIQAVLVGLLSGMVVGLIPGITIILGFILFLPLVPLDPLCIVLYGIISRMGSQFFGSIAVLYLRIPGESSSYPTLMEINNLKTRDMFTAVMLTNLGSLIATVVSCIILFFILYSDVSKHIHFPILLKIFIFYVLVFMAIFSKRKFFMNIFLLLAATFINFYPELATMARNYLPTTPIYYFNNQLILIIIFISQLLWYNGATIQNTKVDRNIKNFNIRKYLGNISLHSIFGCVVGLVPQLGSTISSYVSYAFEKFRKSNTLKKITASETSNNSAAIIGWLPLLVFGVPLTASELVLVQYFQKFNLTFSFVKDQTTVYIIIGCLLISGIIYYMLATSVNQRYYVALVKLIQKRLVTYSLFFISLAVFYFANSYDIKYLLIHCSIFLPVSYLFYKYQVDLLTVVVGLLLTDEIYHTTLRVIQIYFN